MEQEKKKSNKKIIIILSIIIFLLVVAFASYIIYEKYQENLIQEKRALLENTKQKYESINSDIEKLILSEEEQKEINEQIEMVKNAIDNDIITDEISSTIENITSKIEKIETNNNSILEEEEKKSNEIDISKFNEEQKKKVEEFEKIRYDIQVMSFQGKEDPEKMKKLQEMYNILNEDKTIKEYFDIEVRFNIMLADVNKIISESVKELI